MSIVTYEGRIIQGQIRLKDAPALPEGAVVYLIVPETEPTGMPFDPTPEEIALAVRLALEDFSAGRVVEINNTDDLWRAVNGLDSQAPPATNEQA